MAAVTEAATEYTLWVMKQEQEGKEFLCCDEYGELSWLSRVAKFTGVLTPEEEQNFCVLKALAAGPSAWIAGVGCTIISGVYIMAKRGE